ncbi:MAG: IS630 family transposase [Thermoplasmata archaeon]
MLPSPPRGPRARVFVRLNSGDRLRLTQILRCRTAPLREVQRAQIVLLAHRGWPNAAIARHLHLAENTVRLWRRRSVEDPEHGLEDRPRPGRPRRYTDLDRATVIAFACELPARRGLPLSRLSHADIAREIRAEIPSAPSRSTIARWLRANSLRPWHYRYWKFPRDPHFQEQAEQVIDLYHRRWEGRHLGPNEYVLSADEKTCIQVLHRTHPTAAPSPGHAIRVEHEYSRGEPVLYLAAVDVARGKVIGDLPEANTKVTFYRFVDRVMAREPYRSAHRVYWVLDHGHSHHPATFGEWMAQRHPNALPVYTPTHSSWLNVIENYFSALTRKALTPNDFPTREALRERIQGFERWRNRAARPIRWRFDRPDLDHLMERWASEGITFEESSVAA